MNNKSPPIPPVVQTNSNLTPRKIRQRSRSLNTKKVLQVYTPTNEQHTKVHGDDLAQLYKMDVSKLINSIRNFYHYLLIRLFYV